MSFVIGLETASGGANVDPTENHSLNITSTHVAGQNEVVTGAKAWTRDDVSGGVLDVGLVDLTDGKKLVGVVSITPASQILDWHHSSFTQPISLVEGHEYAVSYAVRSRLRLGNTYLNGGVEQSQLDGSSPLADPFVSKGSSNGKMHHIVLIGATSPTVAVTTPPTDINVGTSNSVTVTSTSTVPTTVNTLIQFNGVSLAPSSVVDNGANSYTLNFTVPRTLDCLYSKTGYPVTVKVGTDTSAATAAVKFLPEAGYDFTDGVNPLSTNDSYLSFNSSSNPTTGSQAVFVTPVSDGTNSIAITVNPDFSVEATPKPVADTPIPRYFRNTDGVAGAEENYTLKVTPSTGTPDTTPNAFTLVAVTGAELSAVDVECPSVVTVEGVDAATDIPISITGGKYAVSTDNGVTFGAPTAAATNVQLGYQIKVFGNSSDQPLTATNTELSIGGVSADFVITTKPGIIMPTLTSNIPSQSTAIGASTTLDVKPYFSDATSYVFSNHPGVTDNGDGTVTLNSSTDGFHVIEVTGLNDEGSIKTSFSWLVGVGGSGSSAGSRRAFQPTTEFVNVIVAIRDGSRVLVSQDGLSGAEVAPVKINIGGSFAQHLSGGSNQELSTTSNTVPLNGPGEYLIPKPVTASPTTIGIAAQRGADVEYRIERG